jgi:heat shock protein HslJ
MFKAQAAIFVLMLAQPAMADEISGRWRLAQIDQQAFGAEATLEVGEDGRIGGRAPCNRWFARGEGEDGALMGGIVSTKMACDDLDAEILFFEALAEMESAEIGAAKMILRGQGREMVFVPKE